MWEKLNAVLLVISPEGRKHQWEGRQRLTAMIEMLPKFRIPVSPGRDVEIPLHFVPFQTPVYPTAMARARSSTHPLWRLFELLLLLLPAAHLP